MKKLLALLLVAMLITAACSKSPATSGGAAAVAVPEITQIYSSEIPSLNYYTQGSAVTYEEVAMLVDGLIEFDKYGIVKPAIARSWENSADGLVWTFHLRNDVKWVDSKGAFVANVTANDFVTAAKYCLDFDKASYYSDFYYSYFVNAWEYFCDKDPDYDGATISDFSQVGVKALDDYTLQYTLIEPLPYFMSMMNWIPFYPAYQPFLDQVGDLFGTSHENFLYNGAMRIESWTPQDSRVLVKNDTYYLANEIHINKITSRYNAEAGTLAPEMFLRGEVKYADLSTAVVDEWLADPAKAKLIRPSLPAGYSYFYAFNFDPHFDNEYEPENWRKAVNNRNFRLAVNHAFNRMTAMYTADPYTPESNLIKTITPPNFCDSGGLDYTQTGALAYVSNQLPTFDEALAKRYRDQARDELRAAGVTFPIKALMPFNSSSSNWADRCQVVKNNIEQVLGSDFIDIVIYSAPPTNFLGDNRRNGRFAFLECNWGPDYADPETFTDPFNDTGTYNKPHLATGYNEANGRHRYLNLLNVAIAEKMDMKKRYELFAETEAFLIQEAFVIPYALSVPAWVASYLNPFEANYSQGSSMSQAKINNMHVLAAPLNTEEFNRLYEQWKTERAAALTAASR